MCRLATKHSEQLNKLSDGNRQQTSGIKNRVQFETVNNEILRLITIPATGMYMAIRTA